MEKIEQLGQEIIKNLEMSREFFDEDIKYYQDHNTNIFRTGWCSGFAISLHDKDQTIETSIYCKLFGDSSEDGEEQPLHTKIGNLLDSEDNRTKLIGILQPWLQNAAETEVYGGFYYDELEITIYSDTLKYGDNIEFKVADEKRKQQYLANVKEFIEKDGYKTDCLDKMDTNLKGLTLTIMTQFYPEIGINKLENIFDTLEQRLSKHDFEEVVKGAQDALFDKETMCENGKFKNTLQCLDLACYICVLLIRNGKNYKTTLQSLAKDYKYAKAAEIIEYGSGKFNKEDIVFKSINITCIANDVTRVVDIKFTIVDAESYSQAILFLTKLVKIGFPLGYIIKANVGTKECISIPKLKKTATNKFWKSFENYPETFPLIEKYIREVMKLNVAPFLYYTDAEESESVPVGGYASFVLGMYDLQNYQDVVSDFLANADYEHALTVRQFYNSVFDNLDEKHQKQIENKKYW